jgi:hypothetical protein
MEHGSCWRPLWQLEPWQQKQNIRTGFNRLTCLTKRSKYLWLAAGGPLGFRNIHSANACLSSSLIFTPWDIGLFPPEILARLSSQSPSVIRFDGCRAPTTYVVLLRKDGTTVKTAWVWNLISQGILLTLWHPRVEIFHQVFYFTGVSVTGLLPRPSWATDSDRAL